MPELSVVQVGFLSSVVTEVLKLVPGLSSNSTVRAVVALVVCLGGAFFFAPGGVNDIAGIVVVALTSYKAVVQPLAQGVGLRTQK